MRCQATAAEAGVLVRINDATNCSKEIQVAGEWLTEDGLDVTPAILLFLHSPP